ncbi:hypothetical protein H4R18_002392 [Coemansia javaensis]|uniref:tRNA pseudouridine(55) synthase n=1 Tax=Coemansia javaensis TaxID=2761396 RepID=A0A9W8LHS9_9FUNG|nr:hypothetical protein H4R18_002392 [Coemansia javaensis]
MAGTIAEALYGAQSVYSSAEEARAAAAALAATGACLLCVLRFMGVPLGPAYQAEAAAEVHEALGIPVPAGDGGSDTQEQQQQQQQCCPACLDILHHSLADEVADRYRAQEFDAEDAVIGVDLPKSVYVRQRAMEVFCAASSAVRKSAAVGVKDALKHVVGQRLAATCGIAIDNSDSQMRIEIALAHAETADDHRPFLPAPQQDSRPPGAPRSKAKAKADRARDHEPNLAAVVGELAACSDADFRARFPCPPRAAAGRARIGSLELRRASLFVGGRYLKLERNISQTPFIVDGQRLVELSVAEIIGEPLRALTRSDAYNLVGSGREDADVRMLGAGRPFYVECINPRTTRLAPDQIREVERALARSASPVQTRRLQLIAPADTAVIKEGEEHKSKHYCALVWLAQPLSEARVAEINAAARHGLLLQQMTPVRVLHRRAPLTRPKRLLALEIAHIEGHFYRVRIESEAGAYIKEFVHGDLGRTTPSLASLAGTTADILELDVENVSLDFPPP